MTHITLQQQPSIIEQLKMPPTNTAAWLPAKGVHPFQVGPAPYTPPGPGQIVVKNAAIAINPVDAGKQLLGDLILPYIKYPFVLGCDVAGEVVELGPDVTRFKLGDRVLAQAAGGAPDANNPTEGAFQQYTLIRERLASPIPDRISYEAACVIPLALTTAAYGLFHSDYLSLEPPTIPARSLPSPAPALIITAGASSVGACAIQLAVAAGYTVYSTSSPHNFPFVRSLGATEVFDYHDPSFVQSMISSLRGKTLAGAFAIGDGATEASISVLGHGGPNTKKFVAFAGTLFTESQAKTTWGMLGLIASTLGRVVRSKVLGTIHGVENKFIDIQDLCEKDSVVSAIYRDFLPQALENGQFVPAPPALVMEKKGVEGIQEAVDRQLKGTSAQKVVVSMED